MATQKKWMTVTGWELSGLLGAMLTLSATFKFVQPEDLQKEFVGRLGYPASTGVPIGVTKLSCVVLFLIPQTSVLGAILLTGYLGGAVATHVRVHDLFIGPVIFGVVAWLALYLREPRIRELLPFRGSLKAI